MPKLKSTQFTFYISYLTIFLQIIVKIEYFFQCDFGGVANQARPGEGEVPREVEPVRFVGGKISAEKRKSERGREAQERGRSRSDEIRRTPGAAQKVGGRKQVKHFLFLI